MPIVRSKLPRESLLLKLQTLLLVHCVALFLLGVSLDAKSALASLSVVTESSIQESTPSQRDLQEVRERVSSSEGETRAWRQGVERRLDQMETLLRTLNETVTKAHAAGNSHESKLAGWSSEDIAKVLAGIVILLSGTNIYANVRIGKRLERESGKE